jgi:hypothetical protein
MDNNRLWKQVIVYKVKGKEVKACHRIDVMKLKIPYSLTPDNGGGGGGGCCCCYNGTNN